MLNRFERYLKGELVLENGKLKSVLPQRSSDRPDYSIEVDKAKALLDAVIPPLADNPIIKVKAVIREGEVMISSPFFLANPSLRQQTDTILQALQDRNTDFSSISIDNNYINFHTGIVPPSKVKTPQPPTVKPHAFRLELSPPLFEEEAFELYKKYQINTYGDDPSSFKENGFMDFLGQSNMRQEEKLGTFWWKWYLDNKLIAFSVIDILPHVIVGMSVTYYVVLCLLRL